MHQKRQREFQSGEEKKEEEICDSHVANVTTVRHGETLDSSEIHQPAWINEIQRVFEIFQYRLGL